MSIWSSVVGAAGNLLGGILGTESESRSRGANADLSEQAINFQREMAQRGIRYRVDDAKAAGIHPLYALGAPVFSGSPAVIGETPGYAAANMASNLGQDISRAIDSTRTSDERAEARADALFDLQFKRGQLENDFLAAQISKLNQTMNPAMPAHTDDNFMLGQPDSGGVYGTRVPTADSLKALVKDTQLERVAENPFNRGAEPGAITDIGYARTPTGWAPVPSKDVKERIEDNFVPETLWSIRNLAAPALGGGIRPPFDAPDGLRWKFNVWKGEYQLVPYHKAPLPGEYHGNIQDTWQGRRK